LGVWGGLRVLGCGSSPAAEDRVPKVREVAGAGDGCGFRGRSGVAADRWWAAVEQGGATRHRRGGAG
jgi:hypothetical protein